MAAIGDCRCESRQGAHRRHEPPGRRQEGGRRFRRFSPALCATAIRMNLVQVFEQIGAANARQLRLGPLADGRWLVSLTPSPVDFHAEQAKDQYTENRPKLIAFDRPQDNDARHHAHDDVRNQRSDAPPVSMMPVPKHGKDIAHQEHRQDRSQRERRILGKRFGHQQDARDRGPGQSRFRESYQ